MRYALALILLCGSAGAAEWDPFAGDAAGFNPFAESCPCGDTCPCGPGCTCPDCPHRSEAVALAPVGGKPPKAAPDLIVRTADGCPPCVRFETEERPRLVKSGWTIETVKVPFGSEPTPTFTLKSGRKLDRYPGVAAFEAWITEGTKPVVTTTKAVVVHEPAPVIVNAAPRSPVIRNVPPARTRWNYSGSDLAGHLRRTHGIDPSGMSHQDMVNAHSHAHEGTWRGVSSGYRYSAPVSRSSCPSGNCGGSSRSRGGIFGLGLFR